MGCFPHLVQPYPRVFENIQMIWMDSCIFHHDAITTSVVLGPEPEFGEPSQNPGHTTLAMIDTKEMEQWLRRQTHIWDGSPHPALQPYKVFENIEMMWMGIWIHHRAITTTILASRFESCRVTPELQPIPCLQWLRLQTHMGWFPSTTRYNNIQGV
jgi:hypothetical protein